jgi:hypothetical protein
VVRGLNLTTVATFVLIHLACMRAGPKSICKAACNQANQATYEAALEAALAADQAAGDTVGASDAVRGNRVYHYAQVADLNLGVIPRQVVAKAKHSLRRYTHKHVDMKVRKYYQALLCINNKEPPNLPPFMAGWSVSQPR